MKKTTIIILTLIAIAAALSTLLPRATVNASAQAGTLGTVNGETSARWHDPRFTAGTGECGYYGDLWGNGVDHRNGKVDPMYCTSEKNAVQSVPVSSVTTVDTPRKPVIVTHDPKPVVTVDPQPAKKHCNKGKGNGSEGCDPGNHPEKGNDDEPTTPNSEQSPVNHGHGHNH